MTGGISQSEKTSGSVLLTRYTEQSMEDVWLVPWSICYAAMVVIL